MLSSINLEILAVVTSWLAHPNDGNYAHILADLLLEKDPLFTPKWSNELRNGTALLTLYQYGFGEEKTDKQVLTLTGSESERASAFFGGIRYNDLWRDTPISESFQKRLRQLLPVSDTPEAAEAADELFNSSWQVSLSADTRYAFCSLIGLRYSVEFSKKRPGTNRTTNFIFPFCNRFRYVSNSYILMTTSYFDVRRKWTQHAPDKNWSDVFTAPPSTIYNWDQTYRGGRHGVRTHFRVPLTGTVNANSD